MFKERSTLYKYSIGHRLFGGRYEKTLNNCFVIAAKPKWSIQTVNLSKQSKINAEVINRIQISKLLHCSCPQF